MIQIILEANQLKLKVWLRMNFTTQFQSKTKIFCHSFKNWKSFFQYWKGRNFQIYSNKLYTFKLCDRQYTTIIVNKLMEQMYLSSFRKSVTKPYISLKISAWGPLSQYSFKVNFQWRTSLFQQFFDRLFI